MSGIRLALAVVFVLISLVAAAPQATADGDKPYQQLTWLASGRVTDGEGEGIPGVTIWASSGMGTLLPSGTTATDANGNYTLKFGPGIVFGQGDKVELQKVVIGPQIHGFFEKNLARQGDLWMAEEMPAAENPHHAPLDRVILPNKPFKLDFTLLPTATVRGRLLDEQGRPLPRKHLEVTGSEMIPAASALGPGADTDREGRFRLRDLPTGYTWRLSLSDEQYAEVRFDQPGVHLIKLQMAVDPKGGYHKLRLFQMKAEQDPGTEVPQKEQPWVRRDDLSARLRTDKRVWLMNETPVLKADFKRGGGEEWSELRLKLEWDGVWYELPEGAGPRWKPFAPLRTLLDVPVSLALPWRKEDGGDPLTLVPKRHTARVMFGYTYPNGSGGIVSNRVMLQVGL